MRTSTEDSTQDEFARAVGEGLRQRAAEDLLESSPGTRVHERVAQVRRRRRAALGSLTVVALLGTAAVANDPALPGRVAQETAAAFGLRFDEPMSGEPVGKVGRDATWSREVERVIWRAGLDAAQNSGLEPFIKDQEATSYRVMWADDLAGKRRVLLSQTDPEGGRGLVIAEGPMGALPSQMRSTGTPPSADTPGVHVFDIDAELNSWGFEAGGSRSLLVFAPRATAAEYAPLQVNPLGQLDHGFHDLHGLGNGVWIAEKVEEASVQVRVREDGAWFENVAGDRVGRIDVDGVEAMEPSSGSMVVDAAKAQTRYLENVLGPGWNASGLTASRPASGRTRIVVQAHRRASGGAWAVSARAWDPYLAGPPIFASNLAEVEGSTWETESDGGVVTAPSGEASNLMVALRLSGGVPLVVLAPEGASTVEVNGENYPVQSRVALVPDGTWDFDPQFVAKGASGVVLGTTRLPVASEIDNLSIPR